jgi:heptosyltransferase-2
MDDKMEIHEVNSNCRFLKGDTPCIHHKREGVHCTDCMYYDPVGKRILIIKTGAAGDVIRTTPILRRLKDEFRDCEITWLTRWPDVVPAMVDIVVEPDLENSLWLMAQEFDVLCSLDKDRECIALAELISAREKYGFGQRRGRAWPFDERGTQKLLTGLFDDTMRENTTSYVEEVFEICGFDFRGEKYVLDRPEVSRRWDLPHDKPVVGLNTGCGMRWATRLWPEEHWVELAGMLKEEGFAPLVMGGAAEDEKNRRIARSGSAVYLGHFALRDFISLVDQCDLIVTAVTMALHIAIGLEKKVVLFNNAFNKREFELYGLGTIIEPPKDCVACYRQECDEECMSMITPRQVLEASKTLL